MKKVFTVLFTAVLCFSFFIFVSATEEYPVEANYSELGIHSVETASFESGVFGYGKYKAWYPSAIKDNNQRFPVIVYCNGTTADDDVVYTTELMTHLASWGFIALSNDHGMSGKGDSASAELDFFLKLNEQKDSFFYDKLNLDAIGICGHSQGGSGAINACSEGRYENSNMYKSLCAISAPYSKLASSIFQNSPYDASKVKIPSFLYAGTGGFDAGAPGINGICPLEDSLMANMKNISNDNVIIGRIKGAEHLDTQSDGKAYITAWFLYTLLGDEFAKKAFVGQDAEIFLNSKWQDVYNKQMLPPETEEEENTESDYSFRFEDMIRNSIRDFIYYIKTGIISRMAI